MTKWRNFYKCMGLLAALWALAPTTGLHAQVDENREKSLPPVWVEAKIDPPLATVGDILTYSIVIRHDKDIVFSPPKLDEPVEGLEWMESGQGKPHGFAGQTEQEFWARYRADTVGTHTLPRQALEFSAPEKTDTASRIPGQIKTDAVEIKIQSILRLHGEPRDIRDIKPSWPSRRASPIT